jgi:hypothetical protein
VRATLTDYYPPDPYYFCLDRVLSTIVYSTGPNDKGITIYCDQEKEHELIGRDLVRWHEARLAHNPSLATNPLTGPREVSVHYGPKRQFIPLQLADILANDAFRSACNSLVSRQTEAVTDHQSQNTVWVRNADQYIPRPNELVITFPPRKCDLVLRRRRHGRLLGSCGHGR